MKHRVRGEEKSTLLQKKSGEVTKKSRKHCVLNIAEVSVKENGYQNMVVGF